jgi:hypothetical protein
MVSVLSVARSWSEVTPAWVTGALSGRLPGVVVGEAVVGAVGTGTNSRACISLTYSDGEGPPSVFVKLAGRALHRVALLALGALATEARLAAAHPVLGLEHPLPYAGAVDWRRLAAAVVTEDVTARGGVPNDATRPLSVDQVRDGLRGLARLHAAYWDRPLPASLRFLGPWRLGRAWAPVSVASLHRGLRRLDAPGTAVAAGGDCAGGGRDVPRVLDLRGPARTRRVGAPALDRQFRASARLAASGVQTVLHGDPHPGNTYALAGGRTGFFDWQLARTGHWSHDVGYFVVSSLDPADRRHHEMDLIAEYLDALGRAGVDAPGREEAWARYRATPAFGLATWVHTLSFGALQPTEVCLATIARFAAAYDDLDTGRSAVADVR